MTTTPIDLPPLPESVWLSFGGFETAAVALERNEVVCALKQRCQRSGVVQLLAGDKKAVMTFARQCRTELSMTFITDPKGLR